MEDWHLLSSEGTIDFNKDDINDKKVLTKQEKDEILKCLQIPLKKKDDMQNIGVIVLI